LKAALLITLATVCFAATESRVPRSQILEVEGSINDKFHSNTTEPYDVLGQARGTYLEGYGALFTVELQLVPVTPPNPFKPTISEAEKQSIHDRKLKKVVELRKAMYGLMSGASNTLTKLPPDQQISMEAVLWYFNWEYQRDLPKRLFMTVEKDKLQDAIAKHADLSSVIEEQER
jgi:hypothetical protein